MTQTVFDRNPTLAKPTGRTAWAESFEPKLEELRDSLRTRRPERVAELAGINWQPESRTLVLRHLDRGYRLGWPELVAHDVETGQPCGAELQGLFLYYLERAEGTPPTGNFVAFRELPDGGFYHSAFQGYTGALLEQRVGNDIDRLRRAVLAAGGHPTAVSDGGFTFNGLPRIPLALVYWLGDDEFPPQAQVLFDAVAGHYLPIDGSAALGRRLVTRILKRLED
ncbi:MAG: DUF3786 domain-containing protein [Caldilineaceae bacterium]|nr:DUF3786 domain-containing protein [Caldilineaceae bacterium]MBP9071017.1 DUF3786 domain-containing protein [Caldilineaceae bacterium]